MSTLDKITRVLVVIGALNWGLSTFNADLANWASVSWWPTLALVVYALVGLSGLWELIALFRK